MRKVKFKLVLYSILISFLIFLQVSAISSSASNPIYENSTVIMLASEQEAQMLSSIIVSKNGTVIVIDGGWTYDADKLCQIIKRYGDKVDAWLITHPDPDHIGALYRIMGNNMLQINSIYCSLATDEWYETNSPDAAHFVSLFKELLQKQNTIQTHKNEIIHVGDIKICVLNDRYELNNNPVNNSSIVYKVMVDETDILYLGDLGYDGGEKLLDETPSYLLSADIVQMSHHGQAGVDLSVYKAIAPKIALWSTPYWLWTNNDGTGAYRTLETRNWIDDLGCISYTTANGDIYLDLVDLN